MRASGVGSTKTISFKILHPTVITEFQAWEDCWFYNNDGPVLNAADYCTQSGDMYACQFVHTMTEDCDVALRVWDSCGGVAEFEGIEARRRLGAESNASTAVAVVVGESERLFSPAIEPSWRPYGALPAASARPRARPRPTLRAPSSPETTAENHGWPALIDTATLTRDAARRSSTPAAQTARAVDRRSRGIPLQVIRKPRPFKQSSWDVVRKQSTIHAPVQPSRQAQVAQQQQRGERVSAAAVCASSDGNSLNYQLYFGVDIAFGLSEVTVPKVGYVIMEELSTPDLQLWPATDFGGDFGSGCITFAKPQPSIFVTTPSLTSQWSPYVKHHAVQWEYWSIDDATLVKASLHMSSMCVNSLGC